MGIGHAPGSGTIPLLTPQSGAAVVQAMVDTGNRGGVDSKQFLQAAKECLEAEKHVRANHPDVHVVLNKVSQFLRNNYVSSAEEPLWSELACFAV